MSLPALQKTWQFANNQAIGGTITGLGDRADTLFKIKNSMVSFGSSPWTVVRSCNGVASPSASDLWVNASSLVWAAVGTNHSWIVLQQSGMSNNTFQILFDCAPSTVGLTMRVSFSPSGGFGSGSTTNAPTASDEVYIGAVGSATANNWLNLSNTTFSGRLHVLQSTDGKCTRAYVCVGGQTVGFFQVSELTSAATGWTLPYSVSMVGGVVGDGTSITTYGNLFVTGTDLSLMWSRGGATPINFKMLMTSEGTNLQQLGTVMNFPNDISGSYPIMPVAAFSPTGTGVRGRHGIMPDLFCGSVILTTGTCYPADSSRQFVQFGHLVSPWDGSLPLVS